MKTKIKTNVIKTLEFMLCALMTASLFSCHKKDAFVQKSEPFAACVKCAVLNGPSSLALSYLFENRPAIDGETELQVVASPDVLIPKMLKGEIDIGILPPNTAAKIYNASKGKIMIAAVIGNGALSLISSSPKINSISDLEGKTIYSCGYGAIPEYMLRFLLEKNNVDNTDISFSIPNAELAASIASGKIENAFLTEPFTTVALSKNKDLRIVFDAQSEFEKATGKKSFPITCIVVTKDFAKENNATVKMFLQSCAQSVALVNMNPEEAGSYSEKYGLGLNAKLASKVIPNANFTYISAKDAKDELNELFRLLNEIDPSSIGGKIPGDKIYFE